MVKNRCPQTPLWAAVMKSQPEKWSNFEAGGIACVCVTLIQEQTDSPHAYLLMQIWQNISLSSCSFSSSSYLAQQHNTQFPKSALTLLT